MSLKTFAVNPVTALPFRSREKASSLSTEELKVSYVDFQKDLFRKSAQTSHNAGTLWSFSQDVGGATAAQTIKCQWKVEFMTRGKQTTFL